MPPAPRDLERDLAIAEAITAELKEYLLSDAVYWSLSAHGSLRSPFPQGTLGGLLLRLHLLDAVGGGLSPRGYERFLRMRGQAGEALRRWAVQAEHKAGREMTARLRTWRAFLEDAEGDPLRHVVEYASQAEGRTIIALLGRFAGSRAPAALRDSIAAADRDLERLTVEGPFVWHPALEPAFPPDLFGWLYRRLRVPGQPGG